MFGNLLSSIKISTDMCNCNQTQTAFRSADDPFRKGMVKVTLIEDKPMALNGNFTGRLYLFRNMHDFNWVDTRDASDMKGIEGLSVVYS